MVVAAQAGDMEQQAALRLLVATNVGHLVRAAGTWVHRDFRQQGIARAMWNQVINQTPTYADQRLVSAVGITAAGKGFLESMARTYGPDAFGAYQ